jgi:hypothetical protein
MTDIYKRCWWCGGSAKDVDKTKLWNKHTGEKRSVLLCEGCATNPNRTVWLGWKKGEHASTPIVSRNGRLRESVPAENRLRFFVFAALVQQKLRELARRSP